jgi:hypothetical protein
MKLWASCSIASPLFSSGAPVTDSEASTPAIGFFTAPVRELISDAGAGGKQISLTGGQMINTMRKRMKVGASRSTSQAIE